MGGENSKLNYRKSVIQLTTKTEPVAVDDDGFWNQFWLEYETTIHDIFILIPSAEIRALREESPSNLATLCKKAVEQMYKLAQMSCLTNKEQNTVMNCIRVLTRIIPYLFEDDEWHDFFWRTVFAPPQSAETTTEVPEHDPPELTTLAQVIVDSCCTLLFFPDFTVYPIKKPGGGPEHAEDISSINSCEYIWENGVGFSNSQGSNAVQDCNRTEILKLLLTCMSSAMYQQQNKTHNREASATEESDREASGVPVNRWIQYLTGRHNRHALALFTSLVNVVFSYDPVGYGGILPYNHLMFSDAREPLAEVAIQVLCVTLDRGDPSNLTYDPLINQLQSTRTNRISRSSSAAADGDSDGDTAEEVLLGPDNLFVNFMARIHKDADLDLLVCGLARLLVNPLMPTYLPNSMKKIQFHQELMIVMWKLCDINHNFMLHLLKSDQVMSCLVPILYHMNSSCHDNSRLGVMHIGAFILLLLSGERNFGVKLNKAYPHSIPMDLPVFSGNHADLLILVFHRIITTGNSNIQPLYDCFLTVIVNISPYIKSLCSSAAAKLLHLAEAFSSPWFLFSGSSNHHLIFFLLESINNIIQYQFDGNSNLIYCMIRRRQVFHNLSSLRVDLASINYALSKKSRRQAAGNLAVLSSGNNTAATSLYRAHQHSAHTSSSTVSSAASTASKPSVQTSKVETVHPISPQYKTSLEQTPQLQYTIDKSAASSSEPMHTEPQEPTTNMSDIEKLVVARGQSCTDPSGTDTSVEEEWSPTSQWADAWKQKLPLQTIMRLLQVLVPQVEKICIDRGLTDESEIIKFLQRGTLVGLLPVPHPLLIRKYQSNVGTDKWFRTYMWGVIYLRNEDPPIWYDTNIKLFEIQRVSSNN